jgi:hypothetical protein
MANKPTPTSTNAALKAAVHANAYGTNPGYVPAAFTGNTNPQAPTGASAPAPAPVPAQANPQQVAPVARGAYYAPAPTGVVLAGNSQYLTMVSVCNIATHVGGNVNQVVRLAGGNGGNKCTPAVGWQCVVQGGRKYLPASVVPLLLAACNYTGNVTANMYTHRIVNGVAVPVPAGK